jgi:two-component system sensor histidine kinase/response regulator
MKFLPQKIQLPRSWMKPAGFSTEWPRRPRLTWPTPMHTLDRIKAIGFSATMEDYEKRKLGIFNLLNFFQLITGIIIPIAGAISNRHFPMSAWIIACAPAGIGILVLALNSRREYYLAQIAYFVLYPIATSFVYLWGFNMGVELSFILYAILSVFFIQDLSQMLFALSLSMASYFGLAVVCKNYTFQLATASPYFYLFNQLLAIVFIFYGLFLIKRENSDYQLSILKQKEEIAESGRLLQKQTEELTILNAFKNRLFSIIAHDLKSPIYALRNLFRNMEQYDLPAEEIKELVPEVVTELTHTTSLMENVLHWARSQMQADTVNPQNVDVSGQIEEVVRLLRLQANAKKVRLSMQPVTTAVAYADKDMVNLILRNLLSNAIKYTPEDGTIEVGAGPVPEGIAVFVKDTGTGISPEALEKILMSNFYSTKGTAGEAGTGLGLMLCKEFIQRNDGTLRIESAPGQGSTFTFTLPPAK